MSVNDIVLIVSLDIIGMFAAIFLFVGVFGTRILTNLAQKLPDLIGGVVRGKMSQLGVLSGQARLEKGGARAAMEDIIGLASPELKIALDMLPAVKKWVMKDPETRGPVALSLAQKYLPSFQQMFSKTTTETKSGGEIPKAATDVLSRLKDIQFG